MKCAYHMYMYIRWLLPPPDNIKLFLTWYHEPRFRIFFLSAATRSTEYRSNLAPPPLFSGRLRCSPSICRRCSRASTCWSTLALQVRFRQHASAGPGREWLHASALQLPGWLVRLSALLHVHL